MGVIRFDIAPLDAIDYEEIAFSYMTGYDGRIFPTTVEAAPGELICRRPLSDSGKLRMPWPVASRGLVMLSTTSLRERDQPYHLSLELARGLIGELRNQAATWSHAGMLLPSSYHEAAREGFAAFSRAACSQDDVAAMAEHASRAIAAGCRASDELMKAYTAQKLASHRGRSGLPVVLGCGVRDLPSPSATALFDEAFSAVSIPVSWPTIEPRESRYDWSQLDALVDWGSDRKLLLQAGPLLDFRPGGLPEWLRQWSVDALSFQSFLCDFVEVVKARYRGRIKFWSLAVGACSGGVFELTEEERLTMIARLLEAARRSDDDSQVYLEIDQPWGEYLSLGKHRLAPIQFVDALARSNLGLDGLVLRIDLADADQLAGCRLLADVSKMIDHWSLLGLPLHVHVRIASDRGGRKHLRYPTPADWIADYLPLLMAKPQVTAVFWSRLRDGAEAATGVLDAAGQPKPVLSLFQQHNSPASSP